jgi:hypothetical protein
MSAALPAARKHRGPSLLAGLGAVLVICLTASLTNAFMFELGGPPPDGINPVGAIYLHNHDGREMLLAEVDARHNGLPVLADLGRPSVAYDGSILFGGMVFENGRPRWILFHADPGSSSGRISRILIPDSHGAFPGPVLNVDPEPALDSQGGLIFVARDTSGGEAIFRAFNGELSRLTGTGDTTADGRRLIHIAFGSVSSWAPGECAFVGWLEHDRQAEMVFSRPQGLRVIAAEGDHAAGGGVFRRNLGLPVAVSAKLGAERPLVAFTARTSVGPSLFVYAAKLRRIPLAGMPCGKGGVSFLSTGRPGLNTTGKIALMAQCNKRPVIIGIDPSGRRKILARADPIKKSGSAITDIADPWILDSGAILFGGLDRNNREVFFQLRIDGVIKDLSKSRRVKPSGTDTSSAQEHTACSVTMTANRFGDFAYLGSRKHADSFRAPANDGAGQSYYIGYSPRARF